MKTQMQLANRAWRTKTRSLGWVRGWKGGDGGKKKWKSFCRESALLTLLSAKENGDEPFSSQDEANDFVH